MMLFQVKSPDPTTGYLTIWPDSIRLDAHLLSIHVPYFTFCGISPVLRFLQ